jgi:HAD superfamily hydrolase (TIGR01549 family)
VVNISFAIMLELTSERKMIENKVISFDLDGTLTDSGFVNSVWLEGIPRLYSIKKELTFDEARLAVKREYDEVGNEDLQWYDLHYWMKRFGLEFDWRDLFSCYKKRIRIYPEVQNVLKDLEQRGFRLIIITNASREFLKFQLAKTDIRAHFGPVFSATSDFGLVKKTVDLYRRVCSNLGILPQEMIHVGDDRIFDFDIPRRLGILAFHLDRTAIHKGECVIHNLEDLNKKLADSLY